MNKLQRDLIEKLVSDITKKIEYFSRKDEAVLVRIAQLNAERKELVKLLEENKGV